MNPTPTTSAFGDEPDFVPARMLNEFVYCPRLSYLEWVQREFADNEFTVEGRQKHQRTDAESGALPEPDEIPDDMKVRSLLLSSEALGLIARIDLLEGNASGTADRESGGVVPVDFKRGKTPDVPHNVFDPERVQLCAQGLILRDHGYRCDHGIIYFAGSRQRVDVPFDDALITMTLAAAADAKQMARLTVPPPPLRDSPKCNGCSLAPICLPDEVNLLTARTTPKDVRLFAPPNPDAQPLYINEPGAKVGKSGDTLVITLKEKKQGEVRLIDTAALHLLGNVQVSTQALHELFDRNIPVCWHTTGGYFLGAASGHQPKNVDLRQAQFRAADRPEAALSLARQFVSGKIRNCRTFLRRNHPDLSDDAWNELTRLEAAADRAPALDNLLGIEGTAARVYFSLFTHLLKPTAQSNESAKPALPFDFTERNRRPPRDPVNALLSFAYSLLVRDAFIAVMSVGFDPYLGFLHRPRYGRPSLALDLMEEFRPIIADSVVLTAINTGELTPTDFITRGPACNLTVPGRKAFIAAYERRMSTTVTHPVFGYSINYRRVLAIQARLLARHLAGELDSYPTFKTR